MDEAGKEEEQLFEAARRLKEPAERLALLESACAGAPDLRRRIEVLLAASAQADQFFAEGESALNESILALPLTEKAGDRIGRYKLLQKIGEGGCGIVYMAEQEEPVRRRVALKVIKLGMDTKNVVARFEAERQALAMMDHSNIAKVFDAGATETGRPFFVMELVRGTKITEFCDENHLSTRERLELFIQTCHAVQHAHQKGIIHRDIKPSNILVTTNDGVPTPKVIDFGIAKAIAGRLTDQTLFTAFEQFLGTPAYMSPEQAVLTSVDIDTRSDIYSLGVLLYELLVGKTPFDTRSLLAAGFDEMRRTIVEKEPPRPSTRLRAMPQEELTTLAATRHADAPKLIQMLRGDLDWIAIKCLEKDRGRRYQTANDLGLDIQHHLKYEPIDARPPGNLYRLGKTIRRNKLAFASGVALFTILILGIAGVLFESNRGRAIATRSLVRLHVSNGSRLMNEGDLFGSLLSFTEALRLDAGNSRREESHRIRIASVLQECPKLLGVFGHEELLNGAVFSPNDRRLLTGSEDGVARVWDLSSGKMLFEFNDHNGPVSSVAYSPDNRWILTVSRNLRLWNAETGEPLPRSRLHNLAKNNNPQPCFSPDSGKLLTLVQLDTAQIWDVINDLPIGEPLHHDRKLSFFSFSPNSLLVVTLTDDSVARIWDATTGKPRWALPHKGAVVHAAFSPDNRSLVTVSDSKQATFWDLSSGTSMGSALEVRNSLESVRYDPNGERLVTKSWDRSVQVWDARTGAPIISSILHDLEVFNAGFDPDGRRIVTSTGANLLQMWNSENGELLAPRFRHVFWRDPVAFSSDGRMIATIQRNLAQVWDIGTRKPPPLAIRPVPYFNAVSLSSSGRYKARIGGDNVLRTWDVNSAEPLGPPIHQASPFKQVIFGAEDDLLITESGDSRARVWDAVTGQPLTSLLKTRYDLNARSISRRDLPKDLRPAQDLLMLGHLLSGNRIDESGSFQPLEPSEFIQLWTALRKKYPDHFSTTAEQALAWHEQETAACEQEWNWWAALFHLDRLIAARPGDESLRHRRAYAQLAWNHAGQVPTGHRDKMLAIPPRNSVAPPETIDLSPYYNLPLKDMSLSLASGVQTLAGSIFDLRGIVQLSGLQLKIEGRNFREQVLGINIHQKCRRLHFLHASKSGTADGKQVGSYIVHYADGESKTIPIIYGKDLRAHWTEAGEPVATSDSELLWIGTNNLIQTTSRSLRAFVSTWANPFPEKEIVSIDFTSAMTDAAPFLMALTAN